MKKRKLIKGMMAVAIVAVAGLAAYTNQPKEEMTDVMLANIEALADGEYPPSPNEGSKCVGGPYMCYMGQGMCLVRYN